MAFKRKNLDAFFLGYTPQGRALRIRPERSGCQIQEDMV